jgi:membrane protein YdbS with pleckstrin-like domain
MQQAANVAPGGHPPPETGAGSLPDALPATLRPHPNLLRYYLLSALLFGPGFLIAAFPFYFRYRTLRYEVDDEGITMRWGILFRREISLNYSRIQDIQLSSNVVERWLGLARIQLQTASGSASDEMTIEGVPDVERMRDFLYSRMRGARAPAAGAGRAGTGASRLHAGPGPGDGGDEGAPLAAAGPSGVAGEELPADGATADMLALITASLDATAAELRALRQELARRDGGRDGRREEHHG